MILLSAQVALAGADSWDTGTCDGARAGAASAVAVAVAAVATAATAAAAAAAAAAAGLNTEIG